MKIVIDIPEYMYKDIKNCGYVYQEHAEDLASYIIDGTPLPKGHGRLIDVDALFPTLPAEELISRMSVQYAPVILEADTEKRDAEEQLRCINIKALTRIKENYERLWEENLLSEDLVREEYEAVCAGIDALTKTV